MVLHTPHCATCVDEVVITNIPGREGVANQVCEPIMQIVMRSGDKDALFTIQVMGDVKLYTTSIVTIREV